MHYNKQKKINTINKEIIIFCLKCSRIPLVSIDNSKRVRIICKCRVTNCSFVQYMNKLYQSNAIIHSHHHYCEKVLSHMYYPSTSYCTICQEHLCKECTKQHKTHKYKDHSIVPFSLVINTHKKEHSQKFRYCLNCNETYCSSCNENHFSHYYIRIFEIKDVEVNEKRKELNAITKVYKRILYTAFIQALKMYPQKKNSIRKSFSKCMYYNKMLINFIKIALNNIHNIFQYEYPLISNIYKNSKLTIINEKMIHSTCCKSLKDYINFFNSFSIIEKNKIFDEYDKYYRTKEKIIRCKSKINIGVFVALNDNQRRIALGDFDGNVLIMNLYSSNPYKNEGHTGVITDLLAIPNSMLLTSSEDHTMILWEINDTEILNKIRIISIHQQRINHAVYIPNNRIASFSIDGMMNIWNVCNEAVRIVDSSLTEKKIFSTYAYLVYYQKTHTIIKIYQEKIYFTQIDSLRVEDDIIDGILVFDKTSSYISEEGKLFVGGYMNGTTNIAVINIDKKRIETIIHYDCYYTTIYNQTSYFSMMKKGKNILIHSFENTFFLLNPISLKIEKRYISKNWYNDVLDTLQIDNNTYVLFAKNNLFKYVILN